MRALREPYVRYLRLLGCETRPQGEEGFDDIVRRHVWRTPFENISKLLLFAREGKGRIITLPEFLDGIEQQDLGGTCYASNPYLARLLRALGYDADLLGADMSAPNIHTSIRVRIGPAAYHVDVGYGGPFHRGIRLDQLPHEIAHFGLRYVLDRDAEDTYRMSVYKGGERLHGYVVHGPPRSLKFFQPIVLGSYKPGQTFMTCLRIVRYFEGHSVELNDRTLSSYGVGGASHRVLNSMAELRSAVADGLAMPRCPIEEAVKALEQITRKRLFE